LHNDNIIIVEKDLIKVRAEQLNKNLVLNRKVHTVSYPKLRIYSQDVACKHGATISKINPDEVFYLQSRGIEAPVAEQILVNAFLR